MKPDTAADVALRYRSFPTRTLRGLRVAFGLDKSNGADAKFCDGRIAVIDAELARRAEEGVIDADV